MVSFVNKITRTCLYPYETSLFRNVMTLGITYMSMGLKNPLQTDYTPQIGYFHIALWQGWPITRSSSAYWGSRPRLGANSGHRTKTYMNPQNSSLIFHHNRLQEPPQTYTFYLRSRKTQERKMAGFHKYDVFALICSLDNVTEMPITTTKRAAT